MKISGIYKAQSDKFSNKIYIGSSIDIFKRWNSHLNDLKRNKHHSIDSSVHGYEAINKV